MTEQAKFNAKATKWLLIILAAYVGYGVGLEMGRNENHEHCVRESVAEGELD